MSAISKARSLNLFQVLLALCALFVFLANASAESPTNQSSTTISLGTRVFDLRERSPRLDSQIGDEVFVLTEIDWIKNLVWSDPLMEKTTILIKDKTRMLSGRKPPWKPDDKSRFHPDPTLPPIFDLAFHEVGWLGVNDAPVRGDLLIFPKHDPKRFDVLCAYDRADPGPTFCSVGFLYGPDRNLLVTTRIFQMTLPLKDFAEIAARVDALLRCLDITEDVRVGETNLTPPYLKKKDIAAGGRCRIMPSS